MKKLILTSGLIISTMCISSLCAAEEPIHFAEESSFSGLPDPDEDPFDNLGEHASGPLMGFPATINLFSPEEQALQVIEQQEETVRNTLKAEEQKIRDAFQEELLLSNATSEEMRLIQMAGQNGVPMTFEVKNGMRTGRIVPKSLLIRNELNRMNRLPNATRY